MREAQLKHLESLALAAAKGPWTFINHNTDLTVSQSQPSDDWTIKSSEGKTVCSEPQCSHKDLPEVCNGAYIAAASPDTILNLIAQIKRQYNEILRQTVLIRTLTNNANGLD